MKVAAFLMVFTAATGRAAAQDAAGLELFEKKIRPVLIDRCYRCHSVEAGKRKGGLHVDTRAALLAGGDSGPAVVPGDPAKSLILKALRHQDGMDMPPDGKLAAAEVEPFEAWIRLGAPDPRGGAAAVAKVDVDPAAAARHWAFQPPRDPPVPACPRGGACKNGIDNFILAKLAEKGLSPARPADRRTLLRRVTYDLTGLPPTPAQLDAFLADRSPGAYERVVDRLLASPRYGERWGRQWLDVARYSDTKGYVFASERRFPFAWTYRDWVIQALNQDLPYDQFLIHQIAADRVVEKDLALVKDRRPLAALGFLTLGRRFLERQPDIIDDRIDVVTRGTMGLTVTCARCHDHKYDPIPTKDYYSLYGVFASSEEPTDLPVIARAPNATEAQAYLVEEAKLKADADAFRKQKHTESVAALREAKSIAAYLVAARGDDGKTDAADEDDTKPDVRPFVRARWKTLLAVSKEPAHPLTSLFAPLRDAPPSAVRAEAEKIAAALAAPDGPRRYPAVFSGGEAPLDLGLEDTQRILNRADRDKLRDLDRKVAALKVTHPGAPISAMALVDARRPVDPRVFIRGNPDNPGEKVPRQFLAVLSGPGRKPFTDGSGRLELARAIASPSNPLTARVMVNRVWAGHFGAGLVRTPSDFGLRSDPPTHPELLDWLARRFVEGRWSLKRLHRLMVLSATYQQASDPAPDAQTKDPENLLLSRANRRRLDFEGMRDGLLFAAGRLDPTVGGRPVEMVTNKTTKQQMEKETIRNDTGGDASQDVYSRRRSVYLHIDRQNLPGVFRAFDFASPDAHSPQRFQTTVPQQALFLLNSPFVVEQARATVARAEIAREKRPERRVRALYRLLYGRAPTQDELALAHDFLDGEGRPRADAVATAARPVWEYGHGRYDASARQTIEFTPLPHFTGRTWQGGPKIPDEKLGWVMLSAAGGHPSRTHAAVRRWVAPRDGEVSISGTIAHGATEGDGVEARIVSSRAGELASFTARDTEAETKISRVPVKQGDSIDFIVAARGDELHDGFSWAPVVRMRTVSSATGAEETAEWSASASFAGPLHAGNALSPWEKYAQVLLLSNELMFVD